MITDLVVSRRSTKRFSNWTWKSVRIADSKLNMKRRWSENKKWRWAIFKRDRYSEFDRLPYCVQSCPNTWYLEMLNENPSWEWIYNTCWKSWNTNSEVYVSSLLENFKITSKQAIWSSFWELRRMILCWWAK